MPNTVQSTFKCVVIESKVNYLYFFFLVSYFKDITEKDDRESAKKSNQPKFISEAEIKENEKNNWSGSATNVKSR